MLHSDLLDGASRICAVWHRGSELTATVRQQLLLPGAETLWISVHTYVCPQITTSAPLQMLLPPESHATWSAVWICLSARRVFALRLVLLHITWQPSGACIKWLTACEEQPSPARSPAAARTLLASSWATGCRLLALTQICFYTEITGGGGGSRWNTVRKPYHHFSITGWFERIPGISACNLASVWFLKYLLKRQIFKKSSSSVFGKRCESQGFLCINALQIKILKWRQMGSPASRKTETFVLLFF